MSVPQRQAAVALLSCSQLAQYVWLEWLWHSTAAGGSAVKLIQSEGVQGLRLPVCRADYSLHRRLGALQTIPAEIGTGDLPFSNIGPAIGRKVCVAGVAGAG